MGGGQIRMSGAVEPGILPDVIRVLGGRRDRIGYLLVHSRAADGRIWFKDGAIVAAECGDELHEAAIRRLLEIESGKFVFVDDRNAPARAIFKDTADILVECSVKTSAGRPSEHTVAAIVEGPKPGQAAVPVTETRPLPQAKMPRAAPDTPSTPGAAAAPEMTRATAVAAAAQHPPPPPPPPPQPLPKPPAVSKPAAPPKPRQLKRALLAAAVFAAALGALLLRPLFIRRPAPAPADAASGLETNAAGPASLPDSASAAAADTAQAPGPAGAAETSDLHAAAADAGAEFSADAAGDFENTALPELSADWPDLHLSGLMVTGTRVKMAIINGKTIQEGNVINGVTILSITRTGILVRCSGETRFMPFKRSDVQRQGGTSSTPPGFSDLLRRLFGK